MILFRLLLLLYPRDFRRRYGSEMADAFERLLERQRQQRNTAGLAGLYARATVDALVSGMGERLYGRNPVDYREDGMIRGFQLHLTQALRGLRRAPGHVIAFVLTLGLAIGVNSAVFSLVNGVLLQPLPFPRADRILYVKQPVAASGIPNATFSFMEIDDYRAAANTIDEFVEYGDWEFTVLADRDPHRAVGGLVTSNYFGVLGMRPAVGRLLGEGDDGQGAEPVMLITDDYWNRMFGRDPAVVGRMVDIENLSVSKPFTPVRVVGVLEPGLEYTGSRQPDFFVNYAANDHYQDAAMRDARGHRMTHLFARVAPGVTVAAAQAELQSIAKRLHHEYPEAYDPEMGYGIEAVAWQEELTRQGRPTFLFLMGTVGIILLLGAANVTNLTLTRLIRKERELSTRAALGASWADLRLHLTTENALLGLGGGLLGVLLAYASQSAMVAYARRFTVRAQEVGVDWTVLFATLGGGMLLAALLAWLPGLPAAPGADRAAFTQSRATDSRWRKRLQRGLAVSQLAISFTLLAGAGLLVRSLAKLASVDPGFRTERILTAEAPTGPAGVALPIGNTPDWEHALEEIRAFPGVRSAAVASWAPLSVPTPTALRVTVDGEVDTGEPAHLASANNISPGYFETLGIPLVAGRYLDETDRSDSRDVVILNQSMARAHFGDTDPIGRRITIDPDYQSVFRPGTYEVVGIVADSREHGLDTEGGHSFYRPSARTTWGPTVLVAHQGDAGALSRHIRDVIHRMQPDRAVENVQTMASLLRQDRADSRLNAILLGSFSVLALVIAALGVFGTLAFSVGQRVREFGIRMALGAGRGSVLRSVLGEGALVAAIALLVGSAGALIVGRLVSGLLFGVEPVDPISLAAAAGTLAVVALVAALLPAVRATRIQPTEALRAE